jgi:hypothetical protein
MPVRAEAVRADPKTLHPNLLDFHRGHLGIPERPQRRPTPMRTRRLPRAAGPRETARAVALRRAARKRESVTLTDASIPSGVRFDTGSDRWLPVP